MASEKEKMLKLSTAEAKRSWRAEVLGPENVNLTAGSLSPLPPAPEGWHEPQNPARLPGNSAGQPPHGSRGIASQIESFQTEMHNLTSTQRTQGSPSPQESPILLGDAKKRQMTPASSVSSAGGKYQRVESADPPAPSQDDVSMGSGPSQTFEGEGQIVAPPLPGQSSTGQRDPWKSWFDAHFHDAIQVHQRTYQNFHEKLLKTVTDYHQEFQRSIGTKLLSVLDRVAADLGGQHSEEKRQLFETISGAISLSTQSLAQECRQLIDIQNAEMRTQLHAEVSGVVTALARKLDAECAANFTKFSHRIEKVENDQRAMVSRVNLFEVEFNHFSARVNRKFHESDASFVDVYGKLPEFDAKIADLRSLVENGASDGEMMVDGAEVPPPPSP